MSNIIWKGSPNYTAGRGGHKIDHITLHIMAGFLAGTDSTFANPAMQTSAHYGIGRNGEIHQYVRENDTAWADGNALSNQTGISIEHEGGIPQAQCTRQCMDASARLCAEIARRMGWKKLVHNGEHGNVYLHREVYGSTHTTCPDLAPNGLDVRYVIDKANQILAGSGSNNNNNNNTNNNGGNAMNKNDIHAIAAGVWEYVWDKDRNRNNMYNTIRGTIVNLLNKLPGNVWNEKVRNVRACDRLAGVDTAANNVNNMLTKNDEWKWLTSRVYRLADLFFNHKNDTGIVVNISEKQINEIAEKVVAKLNENK